MEHLHASNQWSNRPDAERFNSLKELYAATKGYADIAKTANVPYQTLRVEPSGTDVVLVGKAGTPARLTNWAFTQLTSKVQSPASFLRQLPAPMACDVLNHRLQTVRVADEDGEDKAQLMFHANGSLLLRAITSQRYERIWNWEIAERLLQMEDSGSYEVAKPDIRVIDNRLPLYASDHDMFAFLRSTSKVIDEPGRNEPLYRGFIVSNSEVGAATLKVVRFLYREMCGNHIIWGASNVVEMSLRHIGDIRKNWMKFQMQVKQWDDATTDADNAIIRRAINTRIAATKDEVLDTIFGRKVPGLTKQVIAASYSAVNEAEDGDPRTIWGFVQGATRYSQTIPNADERMQIDRAAGKLMEVNF